MSSAMTPTLAIFASDRGPGDPQRASIMSELGLVFARKGAKLICLAEDGIIPVPLITAARAAGGAVEVIADSSIALPPALADVPISVIAERKERYAALAARTEALVAVPGSLASGAALFGAWSSEFKRPVIMLNRNRAFEVIRGFANDVLAQSVKNFDRNIQFADTVEELWGKTIWALEQRR
jgi:predicted Rossmann-fold nucleotide-binding protein